MIPIDGREVWRLHAQHGVPIELSLPIIAERGYVPTWVDLVRAADSDGANIPRLLDRLAAAVADSYERGVATEIKARLRLLPRFFAEQVTTDRRAVT